MNILITGKKGTGKTNLLNLLRGYLKSKGSEVYYIDSDDFYTNKYAHETSPQELLDKTLSSKEAHLIICAQAAHDLFPDYLMRFDAIIELRGLEVGEFLWIERGKLE